MVQVTNLGQFRIDIKRIADAIDQQPSVVRRRIALDAFGRIQRRTPRDTGRAALGWDLEQTRFVSTILNQVPYIVPLEFGHSNQAPNGMVRITLAELEAELQARFRL